MKKTLIIVLLLCFALNMSGCSKGKTASGIISNNSQITSNKTDVSIQYNRAVNAYIEHLEKSSNSYKGQSFGTYAIYDMNDDQIPELLYFVEFHLAICIYQDNSVKELDTAGFNGMNGSIKILSNGSILYENVGTGTTYCYETLNKDYTLTDMYFHYGDFEGREYDLFEFDGEKVTKDKWHELTRDIFATSEATDIEWKSILD